MSERRHPLGYDEHLETLTALITYLGLAESRSRTAPGLAAALGLDEGEVALVLDGFPGLFRKSRNQGEQGHFFTLHARYALRRGDETGDEVLDPDLLGTLLGLAADRAAAERDRRHRRGAYVLQLGVSGVAAAAAILAAVIAAGS